MTQEMARKSLSAGRPRLKMAEPGMIGNLRMKNRLMLAPMGTNYSTTDGISTERDKQYYVQRAIGGVSMIMTEAMVMTEDARNHRNSLCAFHDRFIPGLATLVEAIKQHDCHVFGQISHRGGLLKRSVLNMEPVGPSPWRNPNTGDSVRQLEVSEIIAIQKDFVRAARRLHKAGYDGVELHGANGYLFHQFFTPRVNKRTDTYGGSVENRSRLLLETVARIKDELPDWPLLVRVSCTEYIEDGYPVEDVVVLAQALEKAGVAALDLSGGTNESPELSRFCIQPPSMPRRCLEPYARRIKEAVTVPVIMAGRIITPEDAEGVLQEGSADYVSLGRALIADPYWPAKALGVIRTPIRECISCNVCFERLTLELDVSCVQNPMVGTEFETLDFAEPQILSPEGTPHGKRKRVLVLGAGVAGLEAARVAASCGHTVEVWEKADRPGGQIPLAMAAPDKEEVEPVWTYRWKQALSHGIPVRTGIDASASAIRNFKPDLVVVATGSGPRALTLTVSRGTAAPSILDAWTVLSDRNAIPDGAAVTIIGGGMVGIETADLLIQRGCRITIIEAAPTVAPAMARNNRVDILLRLAAAGVAILKNTQVAEVEDSALRLISQGETKKIPRDPYLVSAIGPASQRTIVPVLEKLGVEYALVGDALRPGDFLNAIRDAWMIGLSVGSPDLPSHTGTIQG